MSRSEIWRKRAGELAASFALLTRLPVGRFVPPDETQAVWAYPIVGATVGLIGGVAYWLLFSLSCPPVLAALLAVATAVLVTGALHEDGLADMADGFGGGTPEKRLAIMRDARVGSYGVLALILSVGLRVGAITLMAKPALVVAALIAAGAASRATAVALMVALPHARSDGWLVGSCEEQLLLVLVVTYPVSGYTHCDTQFQTSWFGEILHGRKQSRCHTSPRLTSSIDSW